MNLKPMQCHTMQDPERGPETRHRLKRRCKYQIQDLKHTQHWTKLGKTERVKIPVKKQIKDWRGETSSNVSNTPKQIPKWVPQNINNCLRYKQLLYSDLLYTLLCIYICMGLWNSTNWHTWRCAQIVSSRNLIQTRMPMHRKAKGHRLETR